MSNTQDTSIESYQSLDDIPKRQKDVLRAIKMLREPTNLEISNFLGLPINSVTPRTNELVKKGLVVYSRRKLNPTGRPALAWRAV